jgi:hypothetical protein
MSARLRCQVGDLAFIVNCGLPAENGKLVKVVRVGDGPPGRDWCIESCGSPLYFPDLGRHFMRASIADGLLRPIRPDAPDVDVKVERRRSKPRSKATAATARQPSEVAS